MPQSPFEDTPLTPEQAKAAGYTDIPLGSVGYWEDRGIAGKAWHPAGARPGTDPTATSPDRDVASGIPLVGTLSPEGLLMFGQATRAVYRAVSAVAGADAGTKAVSALRVTLTHAAPYLKQEATMAILTHYGVPPLVAAPIAAYVGGLGRGGAKVPTEPTAPSAPPAEPSVDITGRMSQSPPVDPNFAGGQGNPVYAGATPYPRAAGGPSPAPSPTQTPAPPPMRPAPVEPPPAPVRQWGPGESVEALRQAGQKLGYPISDAELKTNWPAVQRGGPQSAVDIVQRLKATARTPPPAVQEAAQDAVQTSVAATGAPPVSRPAPTPPPAPVDRQAAAAELARRLGTPSDAEVWADSPTGAPKAPATSPKPAEAPAPSGILSDAERDAAIDARFYKGELSTPSPATSTKLKNALDAAARAAKIGLSANDKKLLLKLVQEGASPDEAVSALKVLRGNLAAAR